MIGKTTSHYKIIEKLGDWWNCWKPALRSEIHGTVKKNKSG